MTAPSDSPLFDPGPAVEVAPIGEDARRTQRRRALLAIGVHPTTGARLLGNGETCGSCAHVGANRGNCRTFHKCTKVFVTSGPATDVRLGWPACTLWEPAR